MKTFSLLATRFLGQQNKVHGKKQQILQRLFLVTLVTPVTSPRSCVVTQKKSRKKKDAGPDLTPGTFLEDEEKMLSIRSPRDFTELK
ncbi:hypothetical protein LEMLEM_LOCUS25018, partial [Lemmus lemmus]